MHELKLTKPKTEAIIFEGNALDVLKTMPSEVVQCVVTSPPYWNLRDYGTATWGGGDPECEHVENPNATKEFGNSEFNQNRPSRKATKTADYFYKDVCGTCSAVRDDKQIGLEESPDCLAWARGESPCDSCYVCALRKIFAEVWRVLRKDGTVFLNLGDSYSSKGGGYDTSGSRGTSATISRNTQAAVIKGKNRKGKVIKPKNLMMIPARVALALQSDGWIVRQDIIWHKRNPMPESVRDRFTKAHEYIFLLAKSKNYFFDAAAIAEDCSPKTNLKISKNLIPSRNPREGVDTRGGNQGTGGIPIVSPKALEGDTQYKVKNNSSFEKSVKYPVAKRNRRSVWTTTVIGNREKHYAAFGENLITPCILAGTSEKGCCADCGAPYKRILDKKSDWPDRKLNGEPMKAGIKGASFHGIGNFKSNEKKSSGWQKTCKCETDEIKPCRVMDPFSGTATTGVVSLKFQRDYWGIELNPDYIGISQRRLSEVQVELF